MSRQEGKVVRPFEYCLEKARLALEDQLIPELRQEIIHSELSPDKAWREAKRRLQKLRATEDFSQEDEALARSFWWLAKTKRDHREKFEKRIKTSPPSRKATEDKEEKEMGEKKIEILLHDLKAELDNVNAVRLCNEILSKIVKSNVIDELKNSPLFTKQHEQKRLRDLIIHILEEEYGYKCVAPKEVSEEEIIYYCYSHPTPVKVEKASGHTYVDVDYVCPSCGEEYEERGGKLIKWTGRVRPDPHL